MILVFDIFLYFNVFGTCGALPFVQPIILVREVVYLHGTIPQIKTIASLPSFLFSYINFILDEGRENELSIFDFLYYGHT